jgi:hypothetical protein
VEGGMVSTGNIAHTTCSCPVTIYTYPIQLWFITDVDLVLAKFLISPGEPEIDFYLKLQFSYF